MRETKGLCTAISTIIHESQEDGCIAIDKEHIEEELRKRYPIETIDREFLEHIFLDLYMGVVLANNGYYSPLRGSRIFANLNKLKDISILDQIANNAAIDKRAAENLIKKIENQGRDIMANQYTFDEEFELTGEFKRTETDEEMMVTLEQLCKPTTKKTTTTYGKEKQNAQETANKQEEKKGAKT